MTTQFLSDLVDELASSGKLVALAEEYTSYCAHNGERLPNMAGFFRWMRFGASDLEHFKEAHRSVYKTVLMIFEDEAINSTRPPSLVSSYMRQYFNPDDKEEKVESLCGPITLVFDHDIGIDGE